MKSYVKVRADLELENGLLYRRLRLKDHDANTYQFVVPVKYRLVALDLLHDQFGHLGIDRTTALSGKRFSGLGCQKRSDSTYKTVNVA